VRNPGEQRGDGLIVRHRLLVPSLVLLLALTFMALPAGAGKPGSTTATATIVDHGDCSFTVIYEWSGFSGTGLHAELALGYEASGGLQVFIAWTFIPNQAGSSGSVSATFTLTGTPATHEYFGFAKLLKISTSDPTRARDVRNSFAESGYLEAQPCGSTVTVS
jgi:hypothetical protein